MTTQHLMTEDEMEALIASVKPSACPDWCEDTSKDHSSEYAGVDRDGALVRFHNLTVNDRADIAQAERYRVGAPADATSPYIAAWVNDNDRFTAAEAREIAAKIIAAADKLDEILAAQR